VIAAVDSLAVRGLRVLALARRQVEGNVPGTAAEAETEMEFVGLVGMADPVRPEVSEAIISARPGRDPDCDDHRRPPGDGDVVSPVVRFAGPHHNARVRAA
jgi:hypothetical protein